MPTVADHLAAAFAAHAVTDVFGVMGNGNAYFLDALSRTAVRYTAVRHEVASVVAADAYYRASGRLAVGTATYGAGFTNTLTGLAEARLARIPLVLVVGDAPTGGRRPWDVDQDGVTAALDVPVFSIDGANATTAVGEAIATALAGRTPVVVAIPYDLPQVEAGAIPAIEPIVLPEPLRPSAGDVAEVAALLAAAERPLLLAGRGAHLAGAGEALGRLAATTGALTATSALGRSIFPEAAYDLGVTGGFGQDEAMALIRSADVVVVLGAALNQFTMAFGKAFGADATVVQVDVEPAATNARVDRFVRGDARLTAAALADALAPVAAPWRESVDLARTRIRPAGPADGVADGLLDPWAAATRLGELLPADRVVVSDGGHFIGWANTHWTVAAPDRMVMVGTAFQSIGLGFASVPGAAAARPESAIVLTTGDGGGLMALADLETAVRTTGGRGITVVWNDAQYSAETILYRDGFGLAEPPMLIPQVDFAALGAAFGAEGVVVRALADLDRLVAWAAEPVASRRHLLLDLRIARDAVAEYQREIVAVNLAKH